MVRIDYLPMFSARTATQRAHLPSFENLCLAGCHDSERVAISLVLEKSDRNYAEALFYLTSKLCGYQAACTGNSNTLTYERLLVEAFVPAHQEQVQEFLRDECEPVTNLHTARVAVYAICNGLLKPENMNIEGWVHQLLADLLNVSAFESTGSKPDDKKNACQLIAELTLIYRAYYPVWYMVSTFLPWKQILMFVSRGDARLWALKVDIPNYYDDMIKVFYARWIDYTVSLFPWARFGVIMTGRIMRPSPAVVQANIDVDGEGPPLYQSDEEQGADDDDAPEEEEEYIEVEQQEEEEN